MTTMIGNGAGVDTSRASGGRFLSLWLTLAVSTLIVALTAYVLSFALLGPNWNGPQHRSAVATLHAHS